MYVNLDNRFYLNEYTKDHLQSLIPQFGYNGFGEFIFYRTYSRVKSDGGQENWADVVTRVTEGTFTIRKDWYIKNHIHWDEHFWQNYAEGFALAMFRMEWTPPGRGLWAMGTNFIYERGSLALYNCAATRLDTDSLPEDISWLMDCLMCGVGVGFEAVRDDKMELYQPKGTFDFIIPDTREGWAEATRLKIQAYTRPNQKMPRLIYDKIRGPNLPIKGFGGLSAGPAPLIRFHQIIDEEAGKFRSRKEYDSVYFKTNLGNHTGCCVVAGNVRRSAELTKGKLKDPVFADLKDYKKFPERESFGWMSNNSVALETDDDFESLGDIARRVITRGEPGYMNLQNFPYARIGKKMKGLRRDKASLLNPCAEIPLENKETCNVVETYPTVCQDQNKWLKACEYATVYASTVSLLPTHHVATNKVVARNRRIGVSIVDWTGWKYENSMHRVIKYMREGYSMVRSINNWANDEAGVPRAIRVTTVKPGGTTPKLPGKTPGIGYPTFNFTLRRVRVSKNVQIHELLENANIPFEEDVFDSYTDVFEYPILQGPSPCADKVTLWEQAFNLITVNYCAA